MHISSHDQGIQFDRCSLIQDFLPESIKHISRCQITQRLMIAPDPAQRLRMIKVGLGCVLSYHFLEDTRTPHPRWIQDHGTYVTMKRISHLYQKDWWPNWWVIWESKMTESYNYYWKHSYSDGYRQTISYALIHCPPGRTRSLKIHNNPAGYQKLITEEGVIRTLFTIKPEPTKVSIVLDPRLEKERLIW